MQQPKMLRSHKLGGRTAYLAMTHNGRPDLVKSLKLHHVQTIINLPPHNVAIAGPRRTYFEINNVTNYSNEII